MYTLGLATRLHGPRAASTPENKAEPQRWAATSRGREHVGLSSITELEHREAEIAGCRRKRRRVSKRGRRQGRPTRRRGNKKWSSGSGRDGRRGRRGARGSGDARGVRRRWWRLGDRRRGGRCQWPKQSHARTTVGGVGRPRSGSGWRGRMAWRTQSRDHRRWTGTKAEGWHRGRREPRRR